MGLPVENLPDLLSGLRGKLRLTDLTEEERHALLANMNVPEEARDPRPGEEFFVSQEDFLTGMGTREAVCAR